MKQRITQEQLGSLAFQAKQRYATWCDPQDDIDWPWSSDGIVRKGKLPLLTIGQMIQFLDEHGDNWRGFKIQRDMTEDDEGVLVKEAWSVDVSYGKYATQAYELCDALWDAVKMILEGKKA